MDTSKLKQDIIIQTDLKGQKLNFSSTWGLFSPEKIDEGTTLLLEQIRVKVDDVSLDLGCGYGPIGVTLGKCSPRGQVHMIDKDFVAVEYAKKNADANGLSNARVYLSNGLSQVPEIKFDNIVSNLPAKVSGELIEIWMEDIKTHLKPGGKFYVVTISGLRDYMKRHMTEAFGNYDKLKTSKTYTAAVAVKK